MTRRVPYRGPPPAVSQALLGLITARPPALLHHIAACLIAPRSRYKNCIATQTFAASTARRVVTLLHRVVGRCCAVSQSVSLPILRHKGRPQSRYKICIATHPCGQAMRARAARPARKPALSQLLLVVSWPCSGHIVVVSCLAMRAPMRLCHNTACCIVTQTQKMGSSPASCLLHFFFSLFFFSLFQPL